MYTNKINYVELLSQDLTLNKTFLTKYLAGDSKNGLAVIVVYEALVIRHGLIGVNSDDANGAFSKTDQFVFKFIVGVVRVALNHAGTAACRW